MLFFIPFSFIYSYALYQNLTFIKPEVRDAHPKNGKGFLITSAIIGLLVPIIIIIALMIFGTVLRGALTQQLSSGAVVGRGEVVSLGAAPTPFGEISAVLPVGFALENVGPEQVIIQPADSTKPIGSSIITVAFSSLSPDAYASAAESTYTSYGYTFTQSTTTFLGYPATMISLASNGSLLADVIFEANGETFSVGVTKASAEASVPEGSPAQVTNAAIDGIIASMRITNAPAAGNSVQQQGNTTTSIPATAVQNNSSATITILSPSGGETWQIGQKQTVKWTSVGVKYVSIYIRFPNGILCAVHRGGILPASPGEYSFVLAPTCFNGPDTLTSGQYTINVSDSDPGNDDPNAWSQPFNVVSQ